MTAARETQAIPSLALQIKPTHGGYQPNRFEPNPYIGLACTLGYNFFKGLRDRTWHVPRATDRSESVTIVFPPFRRIK